MMVDNNDIFLYNNKRRIIKGGDAYGAVPKVSLTVAPGKGFPKDSNCGKGFLALKS